MNLIQAGILPYCERVASAGQDKPWLVMVHGASQHRGVFNAQVESFRNLYRILLMDLPGHGGSAHIPGPYGPIEHAECVLAGLDQNGIAEMHFWGTHTGAGVGLLLASSGYQQRFKSLILDGAVLPGVDLPSITAAMSRAKATARTRGVEAARKEWFDEAGWFSVMRENPAQCRAAEHWAMVREFAGGPWLDSSQPKSVQSIADNLPDVGIPALLINGEHDLIDFKMIAQRIEAALPNAQHYIVPGGGGFPLWEYPVLVNDRVRDFLSEIPLAHSVRPAQ